MDQLCWLHRNAALGLNNNGYFWEQLYGELFFAVIYVHTNFCNSWGTLRRSEITHSCQHSTSSMRAGEPRMFQPLEHSTIKQTVIYSCYYIRRPHFWDKWNPLNIIAIAVIDRKNIMVNNYLLRSKFALIFHGCMKLLENPDLYYKIRTWAEVVWIM